MHAAIVSVVLNSAIASAVTPANPAAAAHTAHSMQSAGQRRYMHASLSCANIVGPHESKPRQSKQLMHAAKASVVLIPAIASARSLAPVAQLCKEPVSR